MDSLGDSSRSPGASYDPSPDLFSGSGTTAEPDNPVSHHDASARQLGLLCSCPGSSSSSTISVVTARLSTIGSAESAVASTCQDRGQIRHSASTSLGRCPSDRSPDSDVSRCPLCRSIFRDVGVLWRHINIEHIARREFPPAEFLAQHGRLLCSEPSCSFAYAARWRTCRRSVSSSQRCSGLLVDPSLVISARQLRRTTPVQCGLESCSSGALTSGTREQGHSSRPRPSVPPPPPPPAPPAPPSREPLSSTSEFSSSTASRHLPDCQRDPALAGVAAAAARQLQGTADDDQAFQAIMEEIATLPVGTVTHVPRAVRSTLAAVLSDCLRAARVEGIWGFVRLSMLAKAVLRSPPRGGRRKRYVVSACIAARLRRWQQGDLVDLWREAREDGRPRAATCGAESIARDNARRALRLAKDGRYGDAMRALGSTGCASPTDPAALQEICARHPSADLPEWSEHSPPALVVDREAVLSALCSFSRGASPGGSKLRAQHLVDAMTGTTIPAAAECQAELTRFVNMLLSGRADRHLAPWLVGAPLTGLLKPGGGLRPIAVGEVLRRLVSRLACTSARSRLPEIFLPYGQVGVGIRGGLEAAVHTLRSFVATHGADQNLCCLKLDMRNAFNECSRSSLLHRTRKELPELFAWIQWCYATAGELRFGSHQVLSTTGVQQGDPLGPLLFSLVLLEALDEVGGLDALSLCLWYLDDGTLVGPRPVVRCFLDRLLATGPKYGLFVHMAKCELYWPSGDQAFPEFPEAIVRVGDQQDGIELLGSPVFGSDKFFEEAVQRRVSKILAAQDHLEDLDNPQVALHLLRSCLSLCKVNHLLRTVPAPLAASQWLQFDAGLRAALGRIVHTSVPDDAWTQATLPCRLGGLGLREATSVQPAAFLGSCNSTRQLCHRLLSMTQAVPPTEVASLPGEAAARDAFQGLGMIPPDSTVDPFTAGQHQLQLCLDSSVHDT